MKINIYLILSIFAIAVLFGLLLTMPANPAIRGGPGDVEGMEEGGGSNALVPGEEASLAGGGNGTVQYGAGKGTALAGESDGASKTAGGYSISVSTDKYAYTARDPVMLTINVTVPENMSGEVLRFFGFKNKYGAYKVKRWIEMDLVKGHNSIETKTNVPPCYGCSGISPGVFRIYAALYDNNRTEIINSSTEVELLG